MQDEAFVFLHINFINALSVRTFWEHPRLLYPTISLDHVTKDTQRVDPSNRIRSSRPETYHHAFLSCSFHDGLWCLETPDMVSGTF